ncbi:Pleckstrin -like proteiny domain-containing family G member 4B [Triplophysa tibetana]|uniref:Pleckstrin-like proteiny domain-containing family G member 4B n=1 Tax=Triplophysa tibetana TaxID=1572043 RepID=A0A5A9NDT0_9TELE|nr:Pleckstrin -like proteiny domain-containing family G member 4B [Triplophysa tibetana]
MLSLGKKSLTSQCNLLYSRDPCAVFLKTTSKFPLELFLDTDGRLDSGGIAGVPVSVWRRFGTAAQISTAGAVIRVVIDCEFRQSLNLLSRSHSCLSLPPEIKTRTRRVFEEKFSSLCEWLSCLLLCTQLYCHLQTLSAVCGHKPQQRIIDTQHCWVSQRPGRGECIGKPFKNPDSLDVSIQSCLRVLYSPFEVTAPTVLDQLFQVIDGRYHGDALQCLTDFLIPARHLLEAVQQAACAPYSERVFRCAGWPLCLHERVVIHLAPINHLQLRPGDFYLQVVAFGNQAARIVIQSLLEEQEHELVETPIQETSSIFTENWLKELNARRHGTPLARCVLKTQRGVVKVPWEEVANPEFEETAWSMAFAGPSNQTDLSLCCPQGPSASTFTYSVETRIRPAKDGIAVSLRLVDSSRDTEMDPSQSGLRPVGWVSPNTWDSRSNSRFVGNHDDRAIETQGTWSQPLTPLLRSNRAGSGGDRTACVRTVRFAEDPCTPCMQRKHGKGTKVQECRYRKSYTEAQEKPINSQRGPELSYEPLTDQRNLQKPAWEAPASCSTSEMCQQSNSSHFSGREWTQDLPQDKGEETVSFPPPVVGTSEKCHIVVQGQTNDVDRNSCLERIPRLHVVPGRKAMTFGLVSPKVNRRRLLKQDDPEDSEKSSSLGTQMSNISAQNNIHKNLESSASTSTLSPLKADALLYLGIACLTGGQDRSGRAVLEINGDHQVWSSALISSQELCRLLLYLHIISRKEMKDDGMTIVFDARMTPLHPELIKTLLMVQEINPHAVHWVLLLVNKDSGHIQEKRPTVTMETVSSLKALYKLVDVHQLSAALQGSLPYNHTHWIEIHQKLYPFVSDLRDASDLLTEAIKKLQGVHKIDTVQDVQQCILEQRALMKNVLEDTRLVALQRGGGAVLARLRWETDIRSSNSEYSCEVIDTVTHLYNAMEEQVHVLARKSNMCLQHLDFLLQLREIESRFTTIKEWFDTEGEKRLQQAETVDDSSDKIQQTLQSFKAFLTEANERKHQAMMLVSDAENVRGPNYPETEVFHRMVSIFKSSLNDFLTRAELCCEELGTMVYVCHFCERASAVASDCRRFLEQEQFCCSSDQASWTHLQTYLQRLDEFSAEHFQDVREQACCLSTRRAQQVWDIAWIHYQEVRQQLEDKLILLEAQHLSTLTVTPDGHHSDWLGMVPGERAEAGLPADAPVAHELDPPVFERSESRASRARDSIHGTVSCFNFRSEHKSRKVSKSGHSAKENPADCVQRGKHQKPIAGSGMVGCQWFPWQHAGNKKSSKGSSGAERRIKDATFSQNQQQVTQRYQDSHNETPCEETERVQDVCPFGENTSSTSESPSRTMKSHRILEELLLTEVEYVRSLGYILTHYFPLLARPDVPQDLRGQRGRIFGNLEKLYEFHSQNFQQDLEACRAEPLRVGRCFLNHRESFGLYALYSKNKPQSDTLIQHHKYFKRKQMELGDSMDLSSYLLKPVQRISKYSLLLQEILEDCVSDHSEERQEIQAAVDVVRFQLRHGNDLLTMDAIRDCDLNLNEQGQLIRQDEFWVIFRKKRSLRRVFLFQDVILFTKTKKNERGDDVYVYKLSIKTCEIGMTQSCGQRGLCFEIWFRRRRSQDTYILQATTRELKEAWTKDIEQILWEQALKSRELRRRERVFMGMGWKPSVNIQSNNAVNNNDAMNGDITGRETVGVLKTPNPLVSGLQRGVAFPRPDSIGSGSTTSTAGSYTSSSSGRGSMSPSAFHGIYDQHLGDRSLPGLDVPSVDPHKKMVLGREQATSNV